MMQDADAAARASAGPRRLAKSRSMYYGEHGVERREREEREGESEEAPLALRATRPHTVGCIGGCDQEEGVIECP